MVMTVAHQHTIDACLGAVASVCLAIKDLAMEAGLSAEIQMALELAVCEAVNNAIVHALDNQPQEKVTIETEVQPGKLDIYIRERGTAIPLCVLNNIDEANLDPGTECHLDHLPTSGRGLHMIDALCHEWNYHSAEGVNTFHLVFCSPEN